jgi:hypothetical protein
VRRAFVVTPDRPEIDRHPQLLDAGPEPSPRRASFHRPGADDLVTHRDLPSSVRGVDALLAGTSAIYVVA